MLGVAESTVALRIRQLRNERTMLVTLRRDLFSKGYELQCFADISVRGRDVDEVARDLARMGEVSAVNVMLGSPEVSVTISATDRADLQRILGQELASIRGVARIEIHTAIDIRKYQPGYANLGNPDEN